MLFPRSSWSSCWSEEMILPRIESPPPPHPFFFFKTRVVSLDILKEVKFPCRSFFFFHPKVWFLSFLFRLFLVDYSY